MRYYDIALSQPNATTPAIHFTSHPNGQYDPAALNVLFDMPILPYDTPVGGQTIQVEGVPLQLLGEAQDLAGWNIEVIGGMKKGLPLANPNQAGLLAKGQIFQSWGNWEGTEMVLNLLLMPSGYTMSEPGNLMFIWRAGQSLPDALTSMFSTAYPGMPVSINVGSNLKVDYDFIDRASSLESFAGMFTSFTEKQFGQAVTITIQAGKIVVFDSTHKPSPIQMEFTDFVGQPTWIEKQVMQVKTVMRGDLQIGSIIKMPKGFQNAPGFITTVGSSYPSSIRYKSAFQNDFMIKEMRHVGDYRSPDGSAWSTIFNCIPQG
ncbi:hypothetical protein [Dyella sp. 2HG41-7]|uniref:hypothetical protein n=1 Tax=Dyella sp. 2HG41-7 TaxID=2883239 RepID=UPI001F2CE96C|nr:hypothetical protein [Dyella sp. 2HG41-7]